MLDRFTGKAADMRRVIIFIVAFAGTVHAAAAQPPDARPPNSVRKPLALTECRPADPGVGDRAAASHVWTTPTKHRAVATGALAHFGHGIRVAGGLIPSANIAAQAGDIDPTVAAMAFAGREPEQIRAATRRAAKPAADEPIPFRIDCPVR